MVEGINIFREHFSEYKEQYVLIGGLACDLLMEEQGLDLNRQKAEGIHVNSHDLRKHRQDVFLLFPLSNYRNAILPYIEK